MHVLIFLPVHDNLQLHIRKVHGTNKRAAGPQKATINCGDCGSLFNGPIDLYLHSREHEKTSIETSEGYNLNCDNCRIDLRTVAKYMEHAKQVHGMISKKNVKLFRCRWCGHRCKSMLGLYSHIRFNHNPLKESKKLPKCDTVRCNVCGKVLRQGISYKQHVAIHENDRKFQCDLCPAKFMYVHRL